MIYSVIIKVQHRSVRLQMYDAAVSVWQRLRSKLQLAMDQAGITKGDVWKMFWAAQQRFFKLLCISLKVRGFDGDASAEIIIMQPIARIAAYFRLGCLFMSRSSTHYAALLLPLWPRLLECCQFILFY